MRLVLALTLTLSATTAAVAAPPELCGTYTARGTDQLWDTAKTKVAADKKWEKEETLNYVGMGFCDKPDDPARKKLFETWRGQFAAATGDRPEDFEAAIRTAMPSYQPDWNPQGEYCKQFTADKDAPQDDKDLLAATGSSVGCGSDPVSPWAIDHPTISEITRAAYLASCPDRSDDKDDAAAVIAWYWADLKAFDEAKFDKEAGKLAMNIYGRRALRGLKASVLARKQGWTEQLAAFAKKDADWTKLMDAADAGFKQWGAAYQKFKPGLEDAKKYARLIESDDPRQAKGCATTMRKHLGGYLKLKQPKGFEDAIAAMTDPVGLHLSLALARCDSIDKLPAEAVAIFYKPGGGGGLDAIKMDAARGPRYAQYAATLAAIAEIRSERPKFPVQSIRSGRDRFPELRDRIDGEGNAGKLGDIRGGSGLIKALQPGKDGVTVTFKSYKVSIDDYKCKESKKISRIYSDGTVEYRQNCDIVGSHAETRQTDPIVVTKDHAAGLKVGYTLYFMAFTTGKNRAGAPLAAYKDGKMKDMKSYLGIAL